MTQRKFKPATTGGYWVRNVQERETDGPYVLQAEIGNHTNNPPSDDPLDWHTETFTKQGQLLTWKPTEKDLIEVAE